MSFRQEEPASRVNLPVGCASRDCRHHLASLHGAAETAQFTHAMYMIIVRRTLYTENQHHNDPLNELIPRVSTLILDGFCAKVLFCGFFRLQNGSLSRAPHAYMSDVLC